MTARYLIGDIRARLAEIPDRSVDLVMTSPPFLALRSYLPADHPDKALEIGSEPTPADFLTTLLGLTAEWRRVLAPHGSIVVELGDTYSGSGGGGGDYLPGGLRDGQPGFTGSAATARSVSAQREANAAHWRQKATQRDEWPLAKSLCLIPQAYALALSYGIHPLTGQPSPAGQWRVRNVVAWCRPNPPVGALGDKFRPATSYLTIACTSAKRYFDLDAVREPHARDYEGETPSSGDREFDRMGKGRKGDRTLVANPAGAPPLDWWEIPTSPYRGAHYATYPEALCVRPIKSMCPERVCRVCGEPSRRVMETSYEPHDRRKDEAKGVRGGAGASGEHAQHMANGRATKHVTTLGWTDCGHKNWRPGLVLDPFAGSGTTLAVAVGHGRHALGIDLDERNADLARDRIGMLLEVER